MIFFLKQYLLLLVENELLDENNISVLLPCILPNKVSYNSYQCVNNLPLRQGAV